MTRSAQPLAYLPTMFGMCMLFQALYVTCLALGAFFPDLAGHALLGDVFPQFELLTLWSFIYGLAASAIYGWIVASVFVFFHNLWIAVARTLTGQRKATT